MNWKERWTASNGWRLVCGEWRERTHPLCSDFKFFRMVLLFGVKNPDLSAAIGSTQNCGSCHQLSKLKRQASRSSTGLSKTPSPSHQTYPKCWWPLWWMICMCWLCWVVWPLWEYAAGSQNMLRCFFLALRATPSDFWNAQRRLCLEISGSGKVINDFQMLWFSPFLTQLNVRIFIIEEKIG